jgi:hypothetical protein
MQYLIHQGILINMTSPKAPSHMFEFAWTKGNKVLGLIHVKQGGIMASLNYSQWEEGGHLYSFGNHLKLALKLRLVVGPISNFLIRLLLSFDNIRKMEINKLVIFGFHHFGNEFETLWKLVLSIFNISTNLFYLLFIYRKLYFIDFHKKPKLVLKLVVGIIIIQFFLCLMNWFLKKWWLLTHQIFHVIWSVEMYLSIWEGV